MRWRSLVCLFFVCCVARAGAPVSDLDVIRGAGADDGFVRALAPRAFEFPRDHGPHPEFRHEWWYVTGNLDSASGERFGFELTIFRVGLVAPARVGSNSGVASAGTSTPRDTRSDAGGAAVAGGERGDGIAGAAAAAAVAGERGAGAAAVAGVPGTVGAAGSVAASAWRTRQVYAAHFAVTDVARGTFAFADKYSRDALGLAGAQAEPFRVWLGDWVLGAPVLAPTPVLGSTAAWLTPVPVPSPSPGQPMLSPPVPVPSPSPGEPTSSRPVPVSSRQSAGAPWVIHAQGQGYELTLDAQLLGPPVLNGDHGLSRKSAESGAASYYYSIPRIAVHGQVVRAGVASDVHGLAWLDREWGSGSLGAREQGWDWFALQLQDGSALMFYSLRNHDGTRDPNSAGTWVDPTGRVQSLSTDQVMIDVGDHWNSPRGGRYPSRWRIRVPVVGLDVEVRPALANQELGTKPRYWEGAVDLRGVRDGHDATGRGYVELVGYGE